MADISTSQTSAVIASFDFLEGAFARAQRTRLATLTIAFIAVAAVVAAGLTGLAYSVRETSSRNADHLVQGGISRSQAELGKIDTAGGYTTQVLTSHISARQTILNGAVKNEADLGGLLASISSATPSGVTLTSVSLDWTAVGSAPKPAASSSASPTATHAPAGPAKLSGKVTITGTVATFTQIAAWQQALANISGIDVANPTWSGTAPKLTVTFAATLTSQSASARSKPKPVTTPLGSVASSNGPVG